MNSHQSLLLFIGTNLLLLSNTWSDNTIIYKQSVAFHFSNTNNDTIRILRCSDIEIPDKIGKHVVVQSSTPAGLLRGKKSVRCAKLLPLQIQKGEVIAEIIDFSLSESAGETNMANEGGEIFRFKYSEKTKGYILIKRSKNSI